MNLGEKIFRLRTEKNWSQSDLAEALDVSRQSVSKWETDASVPDIDKLVRLSDLFGITLDELIRDTRDCRINGDKEGVLPSEINGRTIPQGECMPIRKIVGIVILSIGFLLAMLLVLQGDAVPALIAFLPFLTCGLTCFLSRRRIVLWCLWEIAFFYTVQVGRGSSIGWRSVFNPYYYQYGINGGLVWSCFFLIALLALTIWTFFSFRKIEILLSKSQKVLYFCGLGLFAVLEVLNFLPGIRYLSMEQYERLVSLQMVPLVSFFLQMLDWMCIALFVVLGVITMGMIRKKRNEKE